MTNGRAYAGAGPGAIEFHYDAPAEFFRLWLGESMTYTAARFDGPSQTLATAQAAKIDHHLDAVEVAQGMSLVDVGCGWGGLMVRAAVRGADRCTGLTLSRRQQEYVEARAVDGVEARLESFEHFRPREPVDAVVSVGAFEHFARPGMSVEERLETYRAFFGICGDWLGSRGRLSLQTMTWGDATEAERSRIRIHEIFPDSTLPELWQVIASASPDFELETLENRPEDYALTLAAWEAGLRARRAEAEALVGKERYAFYLDSCRGGAMLYRRRRFHLCRLRFRMVGRHGRC